MNRAERKIETVEDAIKLLSKLIANHDDRLYDSLKGREDLNEKATMLIDAQIRTEDNIEELNTKLSTLIDCQIRGEDKIHNINQALDKLTELVNKAHQRIERLEN